MKSDDPQILAAEAEADAARTRFLETLQAARTRLNPTAIKQEATERVRDHALSGVEQARLYAQGHPLQIIGLAATVGAFAARRPLTALLKPLARGAVRYAFARLKRKGDA